MPKIELSSKWTCDGRELKPKVGATPSDTWIYNGKEIKPKVGARPSDIWLFNGRELVPQVGRASGNVGWVVEGNKIKPKVGAASGTNTYELNVPSSLSCLWSTCFKTLVRER